MADIAVVGLDIGKRLFHVIGMDQAGHVVLRRRCSRSQLFAFFERLPPALVGMEACASAHFLGRTIRDLGHDARLIPAQFVKPFLKSQKNDYLDAEAIAEAVQRPTMRFVPIKTPEQLDLQALHRVRDRLVARRTSVSNQLRGLLLERGIPIRTGRGGFRQVVPELLAGADDRLSPALRHLVDVLWSEWCATDRAVEALTKEIEVIAARDESCRRLLTVPGVGPLVATAMVAAIADGSAFRRARDFAVWLGLVPKQSSTGEGASGWHHQAGQHLSAPAPDPRCSQLPAERPARWPPAWRLGEWPGEEGAHERRHGGSGQQAGPGRLGGAGAR